MNPFPKEWSDIYVCLESNDINNVDLIYNICIKNNFFCRTFRVKSNSIKIKI